RPPASARPSRSRFSPARGGRPAPAPPVPSTTLFRSDHVLADLPSRLGPLGRRGDALIETDGRLGADGAAGGEAEVADHDVGAPLGHRARVVGGEDVQGGQQVSCWPWSPASTANASTPWAGSRSMR